jgi:hypothetical protein
VVVVLYRNVATAGDAGLSAVFPVGTLSAFASSIVLFSAILSSY